jgi:hypothetical protein
MEALELLNHQLVMVDIFKQQQLERDIRYSRNKGSKQSAQLRILCGQLGIDNPYDIIDALIQEAFEKFFEARLTGEEKRLDNQS